MRAPYGLNIIDNGESRQFSVERLLRFLVALDKDVQIVVKPHRDRDHPQCRSLPPMSAWTGWVAKSAQCEVRLSYHADQSFHQGTSRSSRAASAAARYSGRRSAGRQYRGWEYCIDAAQETGSSSETCDGPGYRTTGSERGPQRAHVKQQGSGRDPGKLSVT